MKKLLIGIVLGVMVGSAASWQLLRPAKSEPEEKPSSETGKSEAGLHLTEEQLAAAGVTTEKPRTAVMKPEAKAFGRVLDPTPLGNLLAEIETADSAAAASSKEWDRLKSLGENAAIRSLEAAEAAMKRDRIACEAARGRLVAGWGKALTTRADLASLTRRLLSQELALARVDVLAGEKCDDIPLEIRVAPGTGESPLHAAEFIGSAPNIEPQAQGQAFLVLISDHPPAPGTTLTARLVTRGETRNGFLLPRAAVVQYENDMFVFVQQSDGKFERKKVEMGPPQPDGIFVQGGINPQDPVVTKGAQQLLSEEFKSVGSAE